MTRPPDDADSGTVPVSAWKPSAAGASPWNPPLSAGEAAADAGRAEAGRADESWADAGWGRAPLDFDPATNRTALERSTARLNTWLGVLLAVLAMSGVFSALGLYFGGRALLSAVNGALSPLITTRLPAETSWLLTLAALLVLVLTGIYLGVVHWARELIGRLGRWALQMPQGPAEDAARTERLRRTLAGWLKFGQWGTLVSALLSVAVTLGLTLYADQWTGSLSDLENAALGPGFTSILGPGYVAFQTLSSLISSLPGVVVTWLILGAILRFVNLTVLRARGMASGPVTPAATVVSNWFLACLILIGLVGLQLVLSLVVVLVSLPLLRDPAVLGLSLPWSGLLNVLPGLLTGLLVYSLLLYGLYFAVLLVSRTFALALARTLDLGNAPAPAPVNAGEAGATPNVYRGQGL